MFLPGFELSQQRHKRQEARASDNRQEMHQLGTGYTNVLRAEHLLRIALVQVTR